MPWSPGQSGNPNGQRKQKKFLDALERSLLEDDGKHLRQIADKLRDAALQGESWAIQMVADRLDGKPVQALSADADEGNILIVLAAHHPQELERTIGSSDTVQLPRARLSEAGS